MTTENFLKEVKRAVTGYIFKRKVRVKKKKTAEEICREELYG